MLTSNIFKSNTSFFYHNIQFEPHKRVINNYNAAPDVGRSFTVNAVTGLEAQLENQIEVYPNPTSAQLNSGVSPVIQWQGITLISVQGKQVVEVVEQQTRRVVIGVEHLAKGIYILEIRTGQDTIHKRVAVE